jgi:hypothetical protein
MYTSGSASAYIDSIRTVPARIGMQVVCYHYETRSQRTVDSDGNPKSESHKEKVDTYSEKQLFEYRTCNDVSGDIIGLEQYSVVKLHLNKAIVWANPQSQIAYNNACAALRERNQNRDHHIQFTEVIYPILHSIIAHDKNSHIQ